MERTCCLSDQKVACFEETRRKQFQSLASTCTRRTRKIPPKRPGGLEISCTRKRFVIHPYQLLRRLTYFTQKSGTPHHRSQSQGSRLAMLVQRGHENNEAVTWNSLDQWHAVDEGGDRYPVIRNCLKLKVSCGRRTYVTAVARGVRKKCGRLGDARRSLAKRTIRREWHH